MGVKTLWSVVECSGERVDLRDLRGQTVAVDLAGWIVQNNRCRAMNEAGVTKPHLRNVFFRTSALLAADIRPIFVLDGDAPLLKKETLNRRQTAERGHEVEVKSLSRTRLKGSMNECRFLLSALGLKCVQSSGEGEALCARINRAGLADAVISDDSDVFCYGARTVLRNFSVSSSNNNKTERFRAEKVERDLGLTRDRMIFMAVFLGCDLFPSGVGGVGKETVMRMFRLWPRSIDAIRVLRGVWIETRFEPWSSCRGCSFQSQRCCEYCGLWRKNVPIIDSAAHDENTSCVCTRLTDSIELQKLENSVKKKCRTMTASMGAEWWTSDGLPKIIREFETAEPLPDPSQLGRSQCPKMPQCLSILVKKLLWTEEYALEKTIPLLTRWQLEHLSDIGVEGTRRDVREVIEPVKILKKRIVDGVPSLSLEWRSIKRFSEQTDGLPDAFESCEATELVSRAYPELYRTFLALTEKQPKKKIPKAETIIRKKKKISSILLI
jgi:flap endonuclease GEN